MVKNFNFRPLSIAPKECPYLSFLAIIIIIIIIIDIWFPNKYDEIVYFIIYTLKIPSSILHDYAYLRLEKCLNKD